MAVYTIMPDLLRNIEEEKNYFRDVLFLFINKTSLKISKDINSEVISIYSNITQNADIINTWLQLMSYSPCRFEKINVDISKINSEEEKFITLCGSTKGENNLIVYSVQNFIDVVCRDNVIFYKDVEIKVLDRDEADVELNQTARSVINIKDSVVAQDGSYIEGVKNINKSK